MKTTRHFRPFAACLGICLAMLASPAPAAAPDYPNRPIRWIVAYAAGGGTDSVARTVGAQLSVQMGQPVVVDNRSGAGGTIGADLAARAPGDGYTMLSADNGILVFNTALYRKLPYDPLKDFVPIGLMVKIPLLLVVAPTTKYTSAAQFLEAVRNSPGQVSYASPGVGSPHHLAMESIKARARLDSPHVPYRGAAPALQDVMGGQVPAMVIDSAAGMAAIKAGKLRALATFSQQRLAALPNVPTLMELGYADREVASWQGLVVPKGTPGNIVARLETELHKALSDPGVKARLGDIGVEATPSDAAAFAARWRADLETWPQLIRSLSISAD